MDYAITIGKYQQKKINNMERLINNLIRSVREVEELLEFNEVQEDDKDLFELKRLLDDAISQAYGIEHKRILGLKDIDN